MTKKPLTELNHLDDETSLTLIIDCIKKIYPGRDPYKKIKETRQLFISTLMYMIPNKDGKEKEPPKNQNISEFGTVVVSIEKALHYIKDAGSELDVKEAERKLNTYDQNTHVPILHIMPEKVCLCLIDLNVFVLPLGDFTQKLVFDFVRITNPQINIVTHIKNNKGAYVIEVENHNKFNVKFIDLSCDLTNNPDIKLAIETYDINKECLIIYLVLTTGYTSMVYLLLPSEYSRLAFH